MSIKAICKSYNPYARGYYSDPAGLIGVRELYSRLYVWLRPEDTRPGLWRETGSTLTAEGAKFVRFSS